MPEMKKVWKYCVGPGIQPYEDECQSSNAIGKAGKSKIHEVKMEGDAAPYNGVRNWRCSECMEKHRNKIRNKD